MLDKAQQLDVDEVFLDLEDAVAPDAKGDARELVAGALNDGDWGERTVAVRVNDWTTAWTASDVMTVVGAAGARIECLVLPKA